MALNAAAQAPFPSKPIRLITLTTAGGSLDTLARIIAAKLTEQMGQQVLVENRTGAGGNVGVEAVVKSAPDGYTIGMNTVSTTASTPRSTAPRCRSTRSRTDAIAQVAELKNVLIVNPRVPAKNAQELIAYARANPTALS